MATLSPLNKVGLMIQSIGNSPGHMLSIELWIVWEEHSRDKPKPCQRNVDNHGTVTDPVLFTGIAVVSVWRYLPQEQFPSLLKSKKERRGLVFVPVYKMHRSI